MDGKIATYLLTFVIGQLHGTSQTDCCYYGRYFVGIGDSLSGSRPDFGLSRNGSGSHRSTAAQSLVVVAVAKDRCRTIDLFDEKQPGHVVGKGHGRKS